MSVGYIKSEMKHNNLTYTWLRNELSKRDVNVTAIDLSNIFGAKAEQIIETSADIIRDYKKYVARSD